MARINFEDDVEAQDEFWELLRLVGGDRDVALGRLIRFFRIAQKAWGHDQPMSEHELRSRGFGNMIESGWAVPVDGGYHALGAKKHFKWYRQKVVAGKKGGRPIESEVEESDDNRSVPAGIRAVPAANPLAPALAPSPALNKQIHTHAGACANPGASPPPSPEPPPGDSLLRQEDIEKCCETWRDTLRRFQSGRTLLEQERYQIARAIQRFGAIAVELALVGARYEPKDQRFDPSKFVMLSRYLCEPGIERFINLGVQARNKQAVGS